MNHVAKNIKKIRLGINLSQEALAQKLRITRQAVSNWENGKSLPDIEMLVLISQSLGVEITELIYGKKSAGEYGEGRKQRIIHSVLLAAVLALLIAASLIIGPILLAREARLYDALPYGIFSSLATPTIYGLAAAYLFSLIAIWKDFRIRSGKLRRAFLSAGITLLCLSLLAILAVFSPRNFSALPFIWVLEYPQYGAVIGIVLFFGLYGSGKPAPEKAE
ncbi:MAG TPA: helix-turn-helix transcriptional regulator [Clostridia bacterium]|nr:helix-turn-helix transcriptional regulator [Clostridia bacterium]